MINPLKKIKIGGTEFLIINLTQPLRLNSEVYSGDPKPSRKIFSDISKSGWHHYTHCIGDHNFCPHGDGPNHQNPDMHGKGIEVFDSFEYIFNKAMLIDLSESKDTRVFEGIKYLVEIKKSHLEKFAEKISKVGGVLIKTGYDKWLELNKPHIPERLPYINNEAADFLASFPNLNVVGIDSLTMDFPGEHYSHQRLKDKFIVESLVHLYEIPFKSRENFTLQTKPVVIEGATGGPVVATAFIRV